MDEYMFRLVVDKKYLTPKARAVMSKKPNFCPVGSDVRSRGLIAPKQAEKVRNDNRKTHNDCRV